ncbi:hypothetical protein GCM10011495_06800 [Hymenobacter frigidus]|uniref:DUF4054 domain-containing protein n=1 Tax=Hymenobacter frigidus TaxID=1524095 RepID=A0ABQ1ZZC2_9BACT|nr:hypothetical protein [Hymenobacter frigidus]GGH80895.1 hypothetical protein GCM10011495_06800 [Hymenobacter frigidus]
MTPHEQQHLDELMDSFNFARVARAMRVLQWRWASADNRIPDEHHIRATVRSYARQAIQQALTNTDHQPGRGFIGTGGFHIEAFTEAGTLTGLYARFTLADYSTVL